MNISVSDWGISRDEGINKWGISSFIGTTFAATLTGAPVISGVVVCATALLADTVFIYAIDQNAPSLTSGREIALRPFSSLAVSIVVASVLGIPVGTALGVAYTAHAVASTARTIMNAPGTKREEADEKFGFKALTVSAFFSGLSAICSPAHAAMASFVSSFAECMGTAAFLRATVATFSDSKEPEPKTSRCSHQEDEYDEEPLCYGSYQNSRGNTNEGYSYYKGYEDDIPSKLSRGFSDIRSDRQFS